MSIGVNKNCVLYFLNKILGYVMYKFFKVKMSPFIKKINELAHAVKANSILLDSLMKKFLIYNYIVNV